MRLRKRKKKKKHSKKEEETKKEEDKDEKGKTPTSASTPTPTDTGVDLNENRNVEEGTISTCPVIGVTVYSDRAEVKRFVRAKLKRGLNEILLKGGAAKTIPESVRVSGGKGAATLLEVSSEWQRHKNTVTKPKRIDEIEKEIEVVQHAINRVTTERTWFESYSKQITNSIHCMELEDAVEFNTNFFPKHTKEIDQSLVKLQNQITALREEEEKLSREHADALSKIKVTNLLDIIILLHSESGGGVELELSYIITDASWTQMYDARADTRASKLSLTYYGIITNNTEEDWNDVNLLLSTATPSLNGSPPELFTLRVTAQSSAYIPAKPLSMPSSQTFAPPAMRSNAFIPPSSPRHKTSTLSSMVEEDSNKPVAIMTTKVQSSGTSTSFLIPRKATIASDYKPHKVTIAQLDLTAKYTYTVTPAKSSSAYLRGACENTSEYPILPGPVSVFLDNNFIASSNIKHCNPREEFGVHLGTDEGVVVEPKPEVREKSVSGVMKKSTVVLVQQTTVIKNAKSYEVKLSVFQNHPQSLNDKLKVKLIEPELNPPDIIINDFNNLVCTYNIPSGKEIRCVHKYQMEYPVDNDLVQG